MWHEARFRMFFNATHEEYQNEPFQRSRWLVTIAAMEESLKSGG